MLYKVLKSANVDKLIIFLTLQYSVDKYQSACKSLRKVHLPLVSAVQRRLTMLQGPWCIYSVDCESPNTYIILNSILYNRNC